MSERSVTHDTFIIERVYGASPARVFAAWADMEAKKRWCGCHEGAQYHLDFRVGGRETNRGGPPGGPVYRVEGVYHDIVPDQRIVYSYVMYADDARVSVSLQTVELLPEGTGTRLVFTEQGAFLDGHDAPAQRAQGTAWGLDRLGEQLAREERVGGE